MSSNTPRLDLVERNLIINGNMDFWQRGTSLAASGGGNYLADRFKTAAQATFTVTASQSTDVPTQAQSNFQSRYSYKATNGTGASAGSNAYAYITYILEGQDYQNIHSKKVRISFWVKSSVTGTFSLALCNTPSSRQYVATYTIINANTWEKKIFDITLDSSGTWAFDNTGALQLNFALSVGTSFQQSTLNTWISDGTGNSLGATTQTNWAGTTGATFQLSQVMLIPQDFTQAGSSTVDVPFQRAGRTIGHELQMCQRYYEVTGANGNQTPMTAFLANQERTWYSWKVTKRASPTCVITNPTIYLSGTNTAASSPDVTSTDVNGLIIIFNNTAAQDTTHLAFWDKLTADAEL